MSADRPTQTPAGAPIFSESGLEVYPAELRANGETIPLARVAGVHIERAVPSAVEILWVAAGVATGLVAATLLAWPLLIPTAVAGTAGWIGSALFARKESRLLASVSGESFVVFRSYRHADVEGIEHLVRRLHADALTGKTP